MQNIDYSKKFRTQAIKQAYQPAARSVHVASHSHIPQTGLLVLIGAVFIFTAGIFVGLKLEQKEDKFARKEKLTVRNYGNQIETESRETEKEPSNKENQTARTSEILPGIKYPPRKNSTNYLILVGTFQGENANLAGKDLIRKNSSLQGRIFKTSSGKLYVGYFYSKFEAEEYLQKVISQGNNSASLKSVKF